MTSPTPHDALFRAVFSNAANAAGELRAVLPDPLASRIDWASLELEHGSFVDEQLSDRQSDLLFSVRFGDTTAMLYVLFEHQSSSDPLMPFRMLRYMVRIWGRWIEANPSARKLPAVVPVLLTHVPGGWRAALTMHQLLQVPEELRVSLAAHTPEFQIVLDDLALRTDAELRGRSLRALVVMTLLLLRDSRKHRGLVVVFREWATLVRAVWKEPNGSEALGMLVRYAMLANMRVKRQDLVEVLVPIVGKQAGEVVMTEGERLIQQGVKRGRAEGRVEGRAEGRAEALLALLHARGIRVPKSRRAAVLACTEIPQLDRWLVKAASATSLREVFGEQ